MFQSAKPNPVAVFVCDIDKGGCGWSDRQDKCNLVGSLIGCPKCGRVMERWPLAAVIKPLLKGGL